MSAPVGLRPPRGERGFAMVLAIVLIAIMSILGVAVLSNGEHAERSSARGANWNSALHVAEAGVEDAIGRLAATSGVAPSPFSGTVTDGTYDVTVTALGRNRYQIDSVGSVGAGPGLVTRRALQVVLGPPRSFSYALFSLTDVSTKNNDEVTGDVWANGSVKVDQNDSVYGSITAATGWVFLDNNSIVTGDVWSGGFDTANTAITVDTGARVDGDATASSTAPGCSDDPGHTAYWVNVVGSIGGTVTTWGNKIGAGPVGGLSVFTCTEAPATKQIPPFSYNPVNYSPAPLEFATVADFQAYLGGGTKTNLSGTFYVNGTGSIDLTGVKIAGDTTIIAVDAAIDSNGVSAANNTDKVFVLVSYYQPPPGSACTNNGGNPLDCAIGMKNNFQPQDNTATLLYAPNGPVAFKNSAEFHGAVYGNDIVLKNNMNLVYDPRVDQIIGFGPVTLEPESWVEVSV